LEFLFSQIFDGFENYHREILNVNEKGQKKITYNHCYIRQPYEQTFRELQRLIEAGSFRLNIYYYSDMFAEWG